MNPENHFLRKPSLLIPLMKSWIIGFCLFLSVISFSQTTNISGIVNTYYKVLGVDATKNAVKLDNVTGLTYGNTVLLIQMKGATIDPTNGASFGNVTSLIYAGNYEVATICSI